MLGLSATKERALLNSTCNVGVKGTREGTYHKEHHHWVPHYWDLPAQLQSCECPHGPYEAVHKPLQHRAIGRQFGRDGGLWCRRCDRDVERRGYKQ